MYINQVEETQLLTLKQVAKMLAVNPDTLRKWVKSGALKAIRIGKRKDRRYRLQDIQKVVSQGIISN